MREYDLIADWYAAGRVDQTGVPEATALAQSIQPGGRVLDIGCGNGIPITRALLSAGQRVVGLDSSAKMLARFRTNCPSTAAVRAAVQACPFADALFDGAVMWGVMFHLTPRDEILAIQNVARVLKPGARFLFTAGDVDHVDGRRPLVGTMNGVEFQYYSFTLDGYRRVLADCGLVLVDFHRDRGDNGYYLAYKAT